MAEHDEALANYFVETDTFDRVIKNNGDVIAGDKGTGKTALFRILKDRFAEYPELNHVEVVSAFNPAGTPIFQRLMEAGELDESQYIGIWKTYVFSLAGNWLLDFYGEARPESLPELEKVLHHSGLRVQDATPQTAFARLISFFRPQAVETSTTFTQEGIPIFAGKMTFQKTSPPETEPQRIMRFDDALRVLDRCLREAEVTLWLVFDRLDEAFQAHPDVERPALRALLRAYLDMQELTQVGLKLFVRNDLFARIIEGGFVNLTHVNARRIPITWEDDDLYLLLFRRLIESEKFRAATGFHADTSPDDVFGYVFPPKVDQSSKRPTTWNWILTRIRDGNNVKSPRNLVDLISRAIEAQKRREAQNARSITPGNHLITGDALKRAHEELSKDRVEDTLLAEAGEASAKAIRAFEGGKAEHNDESLRELFGEKTTETVKRLVSLGFLEPFGKTFKVPPLYRQGLKITQGKAFTHTASRDSTADDDD